MPVGDETEEHTAADSEDCVADQKNAESSHIQFSGAETIQTYNHGTHITQQAEKTTDSDVVGYDSLLKKEIGKDTA